MTKKVIIKGKTGYWEDNEFIKGKKEEGLEIVFENLKTGKNFLIGKIRGVEFSKEIIGNSVLLGKELFKNGKMQLVIEVRANDFVKDKVVIDDLIISSLGADFEPIPEVQKLNKEIQELKAIIEQYGLRNKEYEELIVTQFEGFKKSIESDIEKLKAVSIL